MIDRAAAPRHKRDRDAVAPHAVLLAPGQNPGILRRAGVTGNRKLKDCGKTVGHPRTPRMTWRTFESKVRQTSLDGLAGSTARLLHAATSATEPLYSRFRWTLNGVYGDTIPDRNQLGCDSAT